MARSYSLEGIVLRTYPIGEQHKGVVFVSPAKGVARGIAHGAASQRGKLRNAAIPFASGIFYLYDDPVRQTTKFTDADIHEYHPGLRSRIESFSLASLWAETLLSSHMEGENQEIFYLLKGGLAQLSQLSLAEPEVPNTTLITLGIAFLWRFIELGGLMPNLEYCITSGMGFETGDQVLFLNSEGGFVIAESSASEFGIPLMPAGRSFLRNLPRMELSTAGAVKLPSGAIRQLFRIATLIIQEAIGKPLLSLQTLGPTLFKI